MWLSNLETEIFRLPLEIWDFNFFLRNLILVFLCMKTEMKNHSSYKLLVTEKPKKWNKCINNDIQNITNHHFSFSELLVDLEDNVVLLFIHLLFYIFCFRIQLPFPGSGFNGFLRFYMIAQSIWWSSSVEVVIYRDLRKFIWAWET